MEENLCPVCLDAINEDDAYVTTCNHVYHDSCVDELKDNKIKKCSICRNDEAFLEECATCGDKIYVKAYSVEYWEQYCNFCHKVYCPQCIYQVEYDSWHKKYDQMCCNCFHKDSYSHQQLIDKFYLIADKRQFNL